MLIILKLPTLSDIRKLLYVVIISLTFSRRNYDVCHKVAFTREILLKSPWLLRNIDLPLYEITPLLLQY